MFTHTEIVDPLPDRREFSFEFLSADAYSCTLSDVALLESGNAPYGPSKPITIILEAIRSNGLSGPLNLPLVMKFGHSEDIARRIITSLQQLDLLDADEMPTPNLVRFQRAPHDTYKSVLAEILRAAYAPIFVVTGPDPSSKTFQQIEDAFRAYRPGSMWSRMVNLFIGLCVYAEIIDEKAAPTRNPGPKKNGSASSTRSAVRPAQAKSRRPPNPAPTVAPPPPAADNSHPSVFKADPALVEWFKRLPAPGTWPAPERERWTTAFLAMLDGLYAGEKQD